MKEKIVFIINQDEVFYKDVFVRYFEENAHKIEKIYFTSIFPKGSSKLKYIITNLRIAGLRIILENMMILLKNKLNSAWGGSVEKKKSYTWSSLLAYYQIPSEFISDVNEKSFEQKLEGDQCKVVFSLSSQIYGGNILRNRKFNLYNFHMSLLPQNKGRFPVFWAFMNDNEYGITCHKIGLEIDRGEIIHQQKVKVLESHSVPHITKEILASLPSFIEDSMRIIFSENEKGVIFNVPPYYGDFPTKKMIKKYHKKLKFRTG